MRKGAKSGSLVVRCHTMFVAPCAPGMGPLQRLGCVGMCTNFCDAERCTQKRLFLFANTSCGSSLFVGSLRTAWLVGGVHSVKVLSCAAMAQKEKRIAFRTVLMGTWAAWWHDWVNEWHMQFDGGD